MAFRTESFVDILLIASFVILVLACMNSKNPAGRVLAKIGGIGMVIVTVVTALGTHFHW